MYSLLNPLFFFVFKTIHTFIRHRFLTTHQNVIIDCDSKSKDNFIQLPDEIWILVFRHFNIIERIRLRRVCRRWKELAVTQVYELALIKEELIFGVDSPTFQHDPCLHYLSFKKYYGKPYCNDTNH